VRGRAVHATRARQALRIARAVLLKPSALASIGCVIERWASDQIAVNLSPRSKAQILDAKRCRAEMVRAISRSVLQRTKINELRFV
jgi:hypothetical protein